jgi:hypothetical protein
MNAIGRLEFRFTGSTAIHMHTRAEPGLDVGLADNLETNFTWQPPLVVENITDDDMRSIEDLTAEEIDAALTNWEVDLAAEKAERDAPPMNRESVDVPLAMVYDLTELDCIDSGAAPTANDNITIHMAGDDEPWDITAPLQSKGITSM